MVRGRYWHECVAGKKEARGCVDKQDRQIRIGESYIENQYAVTCILDSEGRLHFEITKCVDASGRQREVGEKWMNSRSEKFWFRCKRLGAKQVQVAVDGCLDSDYSFLEIDAIVYNSKGTALRCTRMPNGGVALRAC